MNNDTELEVRPRPLSAGLWTLFSWLRRDDRSVSSDSLSSAGSDRTVASFAFLTPAHYRTAAEPLVVPPPGPPSDTYKKRVHDRNLRRQHDRDITIHRKYGLYKSDGPCVYDAFSLPAARRSGVDPGSRWDRERRATSECYQRRLAHVPGKRKAPLPPVLEVATGVTNSLNRRTTRKRPAPQPPRQLVKNKENLKNGEVNNIIIQMNSSAYHNKQKPNAHDATTGCKSEKYIKKEPNTKEVKLRSEKSFLKQIFDNKKRNSSIDTTSIKVLPSISELDKQAAEIIETCKSKVQEQNNNISQGKTDSHNEYEAGSWFCISCLRKYNSSVVTCLYCLPNRRVLSTERKVDVASKASSSSTQTEKDFTKSTSNGKNNGDEEKQKLKEMLKEMKDSLPKRPKHDNKDKRESKIVVKPDSDVKKPYSTEMPTLRIGSNIQTEKIISATGESSQNSALKSTLQSSTHTVSPQAALVAQVITAYKRNLSDNINLLNKVNKGCETTAPIVDNKVEAQKTQKLMNQQKFEPKEIQLKDKKDLNTPLKISSLLNPVYIPKNLVSNNPVSESNMSKIENPKLEDVSLAKVNKVSQTPTRNMQTSSGAPTTVFPSTSKVLSIDNSKIESKRKIENVKSTKEPDMFSRKESPPKASENTNKNAEAKSTNKGKALPSILIKEGTSQPNTDSQDQHSKRRDLINKLEQSIARGDEQAAAEAAAKLAQLRLSCSVLSFSSQILSQVSPSVAIAGPVEREKIEVKATSYQKDLDRSENKESLTVLNSAAEKTPPKSLNNNVTSNTQNTVTLNTILTSSATNNIPDKINKGLVPQLMTKVDEAKKDPKSSNNDTITIAALVEDREATRGPVHLRVRRQALMRDLRREAEASLGLATNLQRWIIGRTLCVNDNTPISTLAGPDFSAPFYLCVVESETKTDAGTQKDNANAVVEANTPNKTGNFYTELVQLEQQALVPNAENFECGVCMEAYTPGNGVILRDCVHIFCRDCLSDVIRHCEEPVVACPAMGCRGILQEREIRALVSPEEYERWLARGLAAAESGTRNAFHCRTRDCNGWALCEPGVLRFPCPVCKCINCVPCQAIHDGETCEQHRAKQKQAASKANGSNETDEGTRTLLNNLISKGEALECPECSAIITKKWGCDWVKCSACKTEICWVTRGRRWGPGGRGDTSAGCRCGVDGKRCHPSCGYCH